MSGNWVPDIDATRALRDAFSGLPDEDASRLNVRRLEDGEVFVFNTRRYGRTAILKVGEGYVVAVERTPDTGRLSPSLRRHLADNDVRPFMHYPEAESVSDAMRSLADAGSPLVTQGAGNARSLLNGGGRGESPFVVSLEPRPSLVGARRKESLEKLHCILSARRAGDDAPRISAPRGVGKRTFAAAIARQRGWRAIDFRMGPMLLDRFLTAPPESVLDALVSVLDTLGPDDILVVSQAEAMIRLDPFHERYLMEEFARLDNVLLLSTPLRAHDVAGESVGLSIPGLQNAKEAEELLSAEFEGSEFEPAAIAALARAATSRRPDVGIVPGRLLQLARLGESLLPPAERSARPVYPDEVMAAAGLARAACGRHRGSANET